MKARRLRFSRYVKRGDARVRHYRITVPLEVARRWEEWGVELVDVLYDPENPVELRVVPLRTERVNPESD
jgi:hypothetical protein